MNWRSLLFLSCFLLQNLVSGADNSDTITSKVVNDVVTLTCSGGKWGEDGEEEVFNLATKDAFEHHQCKRGDQTTGLTVKIRSCENCIELDAFSLAAVITGNVLATVFIAFAVYSITGQSKGKGYSGNKASDKMNLINSSNGEADTYQPLNPGQSSEYSSLGGLRRK